MQPTINLSHIDPRKPYQRQIDDMEITDILDEYKLIQNKESNMSRMQRDYIVQIFNKIKTDYNSSEQTKKAQKFFESMDEKYHQLLNPSTVKKLEE